MKLSDLPDHYYFGEPGATLFHAPCCSDDKDADDPLLILLRCHDTMEPCEYVLAAALVAEASVDKMLALLLPTYDIGPEPAGRKIALLKAFRLIPEHLPEAARLLDQVREQFVRQRTVTGFAQLARACAPTVQELNRFGARRGLSHAQDGDLAGLFHQVAVLAIGGLHRYVENVRRYAARARAPEVAPTEDPDPQQTRRRLEAMRALYRALYQGAPVGYCSIGPDGVVLQTNPGATDLLDVPHEHLLGSMLTQHIAPADQDAVRLLKEKALAGEQAQRCDVRLARAGEAQAWARLSASVGVDEAGAPVILMALEDISALKHTQYQLKESEYRWKFAIDGAGDGLWDWNIQDHTLFLSARWKRMLGYDADEIGEGVDAFWALVHPEDRAHTADALQAHLAGATPVFNVEHRLRHKDGRWIWMQDRGAVVARNDDGATARMIGIHTDISERRKAAQLLRQLHAQLGELNQHQDMVKEDERKRIAREIHDDLGQNLLALRLDVAMLHNRTAGGHPRLHDRTTAVLDCIDRTVRSVRNIINNLRPAVLDLGLEAAFDWQVRQFERSSGIRCRLTIDGAGVGRDERRDTALFRVLQESLTNVSRHAQATRVTVRLRIGEAAIRLDVEDNGRGMQALPRNDATRSYGLMGVKERVESFGGDFQIHSRPGRGVRLSVTIPGPGAPGAAASGAPGVWGNFFKLFGLGPDD
ncbi:PAS domain-containing sensor histidine kinase [Duganella aceris]|uniref:PAS domain-containing protein n=1 Tax=Duganella aceris TaxID=2703883 RepID=A0ABX0FJQ1_9BURK|nr:sensor histidine kinase [Duganella aceris]NGZ84752.1 PAS domain-containing protein [Duganella aceris]